MSPARIARLALGLLAVAIVLWSFYDVAARAVAARQAAHVRPITLTTVHWGDPAEDRINDTLTRQFEALHPNIHVQRINAGSNFDAKLKTMMAAGTPPDLFYLRPTDIPDYSMMGLLAPVDAYVADDLKTPAGKAYFDDIYPVLLKYFRYDVASATAGTGALYGLPKDSTTIVMYVNVDLFHKAGVPVPYDGWTWDEFAEVCKKITALTSTPGFENRQIYGATIEAWPDILRNIIWSFGGELFAPSATGEGLDFHQPTLSSPKTQDALKFIARLRLTDKTVINPTGIDKDGGQEFFTGNIGIHGPLGRWKVPRFKDITAFKWDCVPVPHQPGVAPVSQLFTTAWAMSSASKHPRESFELMKFLCGPEGAKMQSELGLAIPPTRSMANSPVFLSPPGLPPHRADLFLKAMDEVKFGYTPREPEWARLLDDRIKASIQLGSRDTLTNAREIESAWLAELSSPLRQRWWGGFPWRAVLAIAAALLATAITVLFVKARREKLGAIDRAQERAGFLFILPWLAGFLSLALGPMILSLLLSFSQWSAMMPVSDARWVGLANFKQIATVDPTFGQSIKVTLYYVVIAVPVSQVAALLVALLMNQNARGISIFRTIYFVPSVVSGVALSVLWLQIFKNDYGLLNTALRPLASFLDTVPPDWFGRDAARWAIPAFVIMGLWGVGGGMIIYLAGLKGIPTSLYEAATIDGAGPMRRFWNVTLPMLSPLLFYNLVMGLIGSFQVFTQAYVMTGAGPDNATLFYVLQLFRQAFEFHNMGYASALAWILFLICLTLTLFVFRASRRLVYYEGLK